MNRLKLNDRTFPIWQLAVCLQITLKGGQYPDARATVDLFRFLWDKQEHCTEVDPDGDVARIDIQSAIDILTEQLDDWSIGGPVRDNVIEAVQLLGCDYKDSENNDDN